MAIIQRTELSSSLTNICSKDCPKIFLFFGERFLCRKAADELQTALLNWKSGTVHPIDGDQEDSGQTLAKLMSFSLLPGLQIFRINDTRLFHSKNISEAVWQRACRAFKANRPEQASKYIGDLYHLASIAKEDRQPLSEMTAEQWRQLFGLTKPADIGWTDPLFSMIQAKESTSSQTADLAERYIQSFDKGLPAGNLLLLTSENVDKRKRLFGYIKKNGLVIDCSVAEGSGAAAQRAQKSVLKEMMEETLKRFGKSIDPGALDIFFERVGFHPIAVVTESEKLALYCADKPRITLEDLNEMVGRSREEALFELTDHFGKRNLGKTLTTLSHLLENGVHGLAILATMRNYIRKLLIFKTLQLLPLPIYQRGMGAKQFQESYLPQLKEATEWKDMLGGHPYALFMGFNKAAEFRSTTLKTWLELLLQAEFRLKGSGLSERVVLDQLFVCLLQGQPTPTGGQKKNRYH